MTRPLSRVEEYLGFGMYNDDINGKLDAISTKLDTMSMGLNI